MSFIALKKKGGGGEGEDEGEEKAFSIFVMKKRNLDNRNVTFNMLISENLWIYMFLYNKWKPD